MAEVLAVNERWYWHRGLWMAAGALAYPLGSVAARVICGYSVLYPDGAPSAREVGLQLRARHAARTDAGLQVVVQAVAHGLRVPRNRASMHPS